MKENVALIGWIATVMTGVVAPALILALIWKTPDTLLRTGEAGQFVSATASVGGFFSSDITTVQSTTGSIAVYNTFSAPRNQLLVVRETLKNGLQLCAENKPDTCVGLAGSWAGDMKPVPHARHRFAGLVTGIGNSGASLWLLIGILVSVGATGILAQHVDREGRRRS
ncbi:MAG: hypothetical protein EPN38_00900 [Rhodanobacteraceae bacterium]|nr:MAG: hypothetical protein EPN38_00900 [Rhodanobacteraceae bacterium]